VLEAETELLLRHQQQYTTAIHQARLQGEDAFQAWFNREAAKNRQQALCRGYWDWTLHILTPKVASYLQNPETQVALEIGYGGGRLLNAACSYFKRVIGLDIHAEAQTVANFLQTQGKTNFQLLKTRGKTIPVAAERLDFIYSFIVFQHLPSFKVFESYLQEIARTLRRGGVAQIYFGQFKNLHPIYQGLYFWQGYREVRAKNANQITLVVQIAKVKKLCQTLGLQVVETGPSYFCVPDGYPQKVGGQNYVTLRKP